MPDPESSRDLLRRLSDAAEILCAYIYREVPYSDGELQKKLRTVGDILGEARKKLHVEDPDGR